MSLINGFLDNLVSGTLNPKGNLGDFKHSSYLYNANSFRLAPKSKFLYQVVFELSPQALALNPVLSNKHREEINMLVKAVDLPKFQAQSEMRNQYNRKKNFQTSITYDPVQITLHDDNFGVTTALMEAYYRYYYKDGNYVDERTTSSFDPRSSYKGSEINRKKYGLDNGSRRPFFHRITIYQLARQTYTGFSLVNPLITQWGHDSLDNSDSSPTANQMTVAYESVFYLRGNVKQGDPAGFATTHYDLTPSPLRVAGGGTSTILGAGGVADGVGSILDDISSGNFGIGSILKGVNTFNNAKKLTSGGLREEGLNLLGTVATAAAPALLGSISNTVFPKSLGNGGKNSITTATGGNSNPTDPAYRARIEQARFNNGR